MNEKKVVTAILSVLMTLSVCSLFFLPSAAASDDIGIIKTDSVYSEAGQTVEVRIIMENNPGIVSMMLKISYDNTVLSLIDVSDGGICGTSMHGENHESPYILNWINDTAKENFSENGVLAVLTFKVAENAISGQKSPIHIECNPDNYEAFNVDLMPVRLELTGGSVNVYLCGDVNSDGAVDITDSMMVLYHVAEKERLPSEKLAFCDTNGDNRVDIVDAMRILYFVANKTDSVR